MNYITRNLENVVNEVTKEYPVVLVTGPRQVGKTTMLQKLMEGTDRGYVTLDDLICYSLVEVSRNCSVHVANCMNKDFVTCQKCKFKKSA